MMRTLKMAIIKFISTRILLISTMLIVNYSSAFAMTYSISRNSDIVGKVSYTTVGKNQSLAELGREYDMGVYEMIESNPDVDPWVPKAGTKIMIPSQFILPPGERKGMILNLAELRLYYYHENSNKVTTHPIGIGRIGWSTPITTTKIIEKKKDPTWYPPKSIRAAHARKGDILPAFVPPGPKNPLGPYAFKLSLSGYLIHGTNRPGGIGVRSSSGCIRMFNEDVENLFGIVPVGTTVRIIHYPYKFGFMNGSLYLEAHEPLSEPKYGTDVTQNLEKALKSVGLTRGQIDWKEAYKQAKRNIGIPVHISM